MCYPAPSLHTGTDVQSPTDHLVSNPQAKLVDCSSRSVPSPMNTDYSREISNKITNLETRVNRIWKVVILIVAGLGIIALLFAWRVPSTNDVTGLNNRMDNLETQWKDVSRIPDQRIE